MSKVRKIISLFLAVCMLASFSVVYAAEASDISSLPEARFNVLGTTMDRGFLAAKVAGGVFLSWRYFPEEATGVSETGLVGADFAVFKNGVKLVDIADSTDFLDAEGTLDDEYVIVTVVNGAYTSRTKALKPAAQQTAGFASADPGNAGYLGIPVTQPPAGVSIGTTTKSYYMDQISAGDVDGDGQLEFVVKWETGAPDVISQGYEAPVIYHCYSLDGKILWELNLGVNLRAGQHYLQPMLYDFDGDGKAEFMVKTAPGSKWRTFPGGVYDNNVEYTYISMPETVHTDWNGNKNWSHTDDYRSNDGQMNAATRQDGKTFQWMVQFFKNWQSHPEVKEARYGADNDKLKDSRAQGGYGWWAYPPQVMMGMYPAGYEKLDGSIISAAGRHNVFTGSSDITGYDQAQWEILNAIPKDPAAFKSHVITDAEAAALAYLWMTNNFIDGGGRDRFRGSGQIMDGPEYFSVFNGVTGAEMDSIPYAVPRGIVNPDGSYTPDIGVMWNDFCGGWDEPYNRVERNLGAVAYLDGDSGYASCIQVRGYYSRTTATRYDWDGENLTSEVFVDSGFEVSPNPFINSAGGVGGAVAYSNTHAGPGRREVCFNPDNPLKEKPECIATVEIANKLGSITCQGYHTPSVMDVDGDGKDEFIIGNACFKGDGTVLWTGYEQRYGTGDDLTNKVGAIEKLGHGDSLHVGYFDPDQTMPKLWGCLEGGWWDSVLRNAATGDVLGTNGPASSLTAWGNQRDNGRAMVGKFTDEPGWQLFTRARNTSPRGTNYENGLRKSDDTPSARQTLSPGTTFSIFWRPDLTTQPCNNSISALNVAGTGFGTGNPGGLATTGTRVCGGTKDRPAYAADVLGDFREELILGTTAANEIRIYFNTEESTHKLAALQSDRRYRVEIERQKSCYGQPSYTSFYYGADMNWDIYFASIQAPDEPVVSVDVSVSTPSIVETLTAYLNITVAGDVTDGLTAYLKVGDEKIYPTAVSDGKGRMYIGAAPATGSYKLIVEGENVYGECDVEVVAYNTNIWSANVNVLDGKLQIVFNDDVTLKSAVKCVTIGANTYNAAVLSDRRTVEVSGYNAEGEGGTVAKIAGVKYPVLFPSYSFTFTVTIP